MKNDKVKLGARLSAVASQVREGIILYDVGSDHAYLPAHLLLSGKIPFAVISDVAEGPLLRAERTVRDAELADRAKLCLCDGLDGIDIKAPCDVSIAGMGGEMICRIIEAAHQLKNESIRLILQPMTKPELLREYLAYNGFAFEKELTVQEGRLYTVIVCRYCGEKTELTDEELLLGKHGAREESREFFLLVSNKLQTLKSVSAGKRAGGQNDDAEATMILSLEKLINEQNGE